MFDHLLCHQVLLHHHLNPVPVPKHDDGVGEHEQVAANHQPRVRKDRLRAGQGVVSKFPIKMVFVIIICSLC